MKTAKAAKKANKAKKAKKVKMVLMTTAAAPPPRAGHYIVWCTRTETRRSCTKRWMAPAVAVSRTSRSQALALRQRRRNKRLRQRRRRRSERLERTLLVCGGYHSLSFKPNHDLYSLELPPRLLALLQRFYRALGRAPAQTAVFQLKTQRHEYLPEVLSTYLNLALVPFVGVHKLSLFHVPQLHLLVVAPAHKTISF